MLAISRPLDIALPDILGNPVATPLEGLQSKRGEGVFVGREWAMKEEAWEARLLGGKFVGDGC
jgi:hypothetical protein